MSETTYNVDATHASPLQRGLPPGWRWVRLLDIVDRITPGKLFDRESCNPEGKVPVVDQSECGYTGFHNEAPGVIASEDLPLVTFANHTCAVRLHTAPFSVIQNVFPLQAREGVDPFFVYWVLCGRMPVTFYGGHWPILVKKEIPLPPLDEQRKIARLLREQMAAVDKARMAAQVRLEAVKSLPAAFLRQALPKTGQPLPTGWSWVKLGDICDGPGQYGTSSKSNAEQRGVPVLGMYHIHEGHIRWENISYVDLRAEELPKYLLCKGDLLFNRTNSAELVGKTAVYDTDKVAVFASYLIRFRFIEGTADSHFVSAFINSREGRSFIEENMARAIGQVNISASTMRLMPIPLPSLSEQKRMMAIFKEQIEAAEKARAGVEAELHTINALPAALLRRAFNGEL